MTKHTGNLKRISDALPAGVSILRRAVEAAGYDVAVLRGAGPTDEQTDRILAAIYTMVTDGRVADERARNRQMAARDTVGDGAQYVRGHTWGDELGTEGHRSDDEPAN